jgi:2-polyprenyl-3-methyl-5-hydroxy-6-metoxy-1,4-benzoquinol methylase
MQQPAQVTPQLFFDTATAYQRSAAIKTALELDVFTRVGEGKTTAKAIADAVGASERGIRILCDSLTVMGFLTKSGSDYGLSDVSSAFLDRRSRSYVGDAVDFLMSDAQQRGFDDLTGAVKRGGARPEGNASVAAESEMWVKFARGMMPFVFPMAEMAAAQIGLPEDQKLKVLDIAAGHGIFGISVALRYPNSEVYGADWANVLAVAEENAKHFGVASRYHTIPGDAFTTDLGSGYDVVLVPNFLHHFDPEACTAFLKKVNDSLADGGRVLTVEFVPNDDRISPPMSAMFALVMLAGTPSGDAYTFAEIKQMAEKAGFSQNELVALEPTPSHLVISRK